MFVVAVVESFGAPWDIVHPAEGVEGEDDEVGGGVEDEWKGALDGIADYSESREADGVDENWEDIAEKDHQYDNSMDGYDILGSLRDIIAVDED